MKLLLDTHIWLWYLLGDARLSEGHRYCLEAQENELWLSPVSIWEAHLLLERGRVPVTVPPSRWIRQALELFPVKQAPLTFAVALRSRLVHLEHEDPADRFLAATAIEMNLAMLTADERLLRCPDLSVAR